VTVYGVTELTANDFDFVVRMLQKRLRLPGEQSSPLLQGWVQTDHRVSLTTLRLSAPFDIKNRARVEP